MDSVINWFSIPGLFEDTCSTAQTICFQDIIFSPRLHITMCHNGQFNDFTVSCFLKAQAENNLRHKF